MLAFEFLMPALSCSLSETLTAVSHCQQMREHELMCAHVQGFKALTGYQFPLVKTDECLFHWKQALRPKLLKVAARRSVMHSGVTFGYLDAFVRCRPLERR
ncbi:hypothetical protein PF006_g23988 [Phytophthora fragariae]|uniref:Uncharacterized protein n=1 Tax=Phytophthora fragariae TaxID=53985 RepID=A0A6A3RG02_9STRA|nr:hypothetical protein PF006_g23988 [Phytophthora fragariae]